MDINNLDLDLDLALTLDLEKREAHARAMLQKMKQCDKPGTTNSIHVWRWALRGIVIPWNMEHETWNMKHENNKKSVSNTHTYTQT